MSFATLVSNAFLVPNKMRVAKKSVNNASRNTATVAVRPNAHPSQFPMRPRHTPRTQVSIPRGDAMFESCQTRVSTERFRAPIDTTTFPAKSN